MPRRSGLVHTMISALTPSRFLTLAAAFGLIALLLTPVHAHAGTAPADFVQKAVDEGVAILADDDAEETARRAKFRDFILGLTDSRRIALFTLGNHRRQTSEADLDAFVKAFTEYAVAVYETRLKQYKGERLKVVNVTERSATDVIVSTVIEGQSPNDPVRVAFRLNPKNGGFIVIDIQVAGIWLAIDQQSQFASYLSQNNGGVPALTAHLIAQAAKIRAGQAES